jgi:Carboxypeptidase regulatory-like domain
MVTEVVRHQVAIAGQLVDAQSTRALAGAFVEITAAPSVFTAWLALKAKAYGDAWAALPERPDRTRTKPDGHFHFLDLPDGAYSVAARIPGGGSRYGTAQAAVTVSHDGSGNAVVTPVKLAVQPTAITGLVKKNGTAIAMAEIRVKGSGEVSYSNDTGRYLLAGVEAGARTLLASAQGCQPGSQTVTVTAGAVANSDFSLVPA